MKKPILLFIAIILSLSALAQQKTGTVRGVISSTADKKPIEGAIVRILGDSVTVFTDKEGRFELKNVPVGYRTLDIYADGFLNTNPESFEVKAAVPAIVNIEMGGYKLEDITVVSSPLRATVESPVSIRRIGREEIDLTPGANRDISKVVQASPGVVIVSQNNRNDVLVRGGGSNENKYFIDDIEIPVLNHFSVQGGSGGYASLINTDLLSGVNFYTGSFPASLSNGLSSVLDMRMKEGNSDRFHGKLMVGASDVGVTIDTPISKNGKTTLIASYRRSYLQFLFNILDLPFLPTYNDYQFKLTSKFGKGNEIYALGIGSFDDNNLNLGIKNPTDSRKYIIGYLPNNDQVSYVIGVGYKKSFKGGLFKVTASRDYLRNDLFKYTNNDENKDKTLDIASKEQNYRLKASVDMFDLGGFRFSAGIGGGNGSYTSNSMQRIFKGTSYNDIFSGSNVDLWRYDAFATLSRRLFNDKFSVLVGARIDGMSYSSKTNNPFKQFSPRLSVSYDFAPKWSINATVARYYQEPTYTTLGYSSADEAKFNQRNGLKYINVNQYVAGVKFSPNNRSSVSLEGFFKQYGNLPVSLQDSLPLSTGDITDYIVGNVPAVSTGKGRAYGAELAYRNLDLHNTVINVSYTLLYSKVNKLDDNLQPTNDFWTSSWDVRHIFNISAIHKFNRNWTLGGKWYFTGGLPYTPYSLEPSSLIGNWDTRHRPFVDNRIYNEGRSAVYHQLDVRVDKVWNFQHWKLGVYVDIQNLYNFKSAGQDYLMPESDANGAYIIDPNHPDRYLMKTVENSNGGTILPTLGITIEF